MRPPEYFVNVFARKELTIVRYYNLCTLTSTAWSLSIKCTSNNTAVSSTSPCTVTKQIKSKVTTVVSRHIEHIITHTISGSRIGYSPVS